MSGGLADRGVAHGLRTRPAHRERFVVTARFLLAVFDAVYLLAMTAWIGSLLFVSFGVAPIIFKVLDAQSAARFVRALFPRYYAWGANSGAVALAAYVCGILSFPEYRGPAVAVQSLLLIAGILVMFYAGNSLTPAINAARDLGPAGQDRFERLHRRSVVLNAVVMVVGMGLLVGFAFRPAPRTLGIVERTPEETARQSYQRGIETLQKSADAPRLPASRLRTP
jgi:putative copper export protein